MNSMSGRVDSMHESISSDRLSSSQLMKCRSFLRWSKKRLSLISITVCFMVAYRIKIPHIMHQVYTNNLLLKTILVSKVIPPDGIGF